MKDLVEYIVKTLVEAPELIIVRQKSDEHTIYIELEVAKREVGKIVGKNGQTIKSLRSIVNASAVKVGKKVVLNIIESETL